MIFNSRWACEVDLKDNAEVVQKDLSATVLTQKIRAISGRFPPIHTCHLFQTFTTQPTSYYKSPTCSYISFPRDTTKKTT